MARSQALTFTQKIVKHILVNIRTALAVRIGKSAAGVSFKSCVWRADRVLDCELHFTIERGDAINAERKLIYHN